MRFKVIIKSDKVLKTTPKDEYYYAVYIVEAESRVDALNVAAELSNDIDSVFLPLKLYATEVKNGAK